MANQTFHRSHRSHRPTATRAARRQKRPAVAQLDLSGVVNRYGPPEAVLRALRTISPIDVQAEPATTASSLAERFAEVLGVDPAELEAGRGPSELLKAVASQASPGSTAVVLPAPSELLALFPGSAFPGSGFPGFAFPASGGTGSGDSNVHTIEQIDEAMDASDLVIISNPNSITGTLLDSLALAELADRSPSATLIVDETFVDFLPEPRDASLVGTSVDNIVVLRSAAELYGMGATRAGVAWSRDRHLLSMLFDPRLSSPLSGLDAIATEAALAGRVWADTVRRQLTEDGGWLATALEPLGGRVIDAGVPAPFRLVITERAEELARALAAAGVSVRVVSSTEGVGPGGLRVSAPRVAERTTFTAAVQAATIPAPVVQLGAAG